MKKIFTFLLVSGIIFSTNSINADALDQAGQYGIANSNKINLEGEFRTGSVRSAADPIIAFLEGTSQIAVHFNTNIGNVAISITDQSGNVVYSDTVNSQVGSVSIPLSQLTSGNYTIHFTNNHGNMWGDFLI